jgi:hypothetical protein
VIQKPPMPILEASLAATTSGVCGTRVWSGLSDGVLCALGVACRIAFNNWVMCKRCVTVSVLMMRVCRAAR